MVNLPMPSTSTSISHCPMGSPSTIAFWTKSSGMISPFKRKRNSGRPDLPRFCTSESIASPFLLEEFVDLFSQLLPEYQQWAPARLIENALRMSPHHFDCLRVSDPPLWQPAVFAINQRKNGIHKPCPSAVIDTGANHFQIRRCQGNAALGW
jgi:hypothetical protein